MSFAMQERISISKQRSYWLRYFLGATSLFFLMPIRDAYSQGIVDCVYPNQVNVSRVVGEVADPFGVAVPGAAVTLVDEKGTIRQTETDAEGRFHLVAAPGTYTFKADLQSFETDHVKLNVGEDLAGLIHPRSLYVILGLSGSYCAWATSSRREFRRIIESNKKRLEESVQRNATQN